MVFFILFHKEHAFSARVIFAITKKKEHLKSIASLRKPLDLSTLVVGIIGT